MQYVLIASPNEADIRTIRDCFQEGQKIRIVRDRETCLAMCREELSDLIFIDLSFISSETGTDIDFNLAIHAFKSHAPLSAIFVLSPKEKIRDAVNYVKAGAFDYLTYPVNKDEVQLVCSKVYKSLKTHAELEYLRDSFWKLESLSLLQTRSAAMREVLNKIKAVAPTKTTVFLTGETGTGKSLLAKLIHQHSSRSNRQFIHVHCGTIPDTLIESEMFGHEKGSFTGATKKKLGRFEVANGGTIFLDEIGTVTSSFQVKLLQVLQEKNFQRVGGILIIDTDIRIIAASNEDLETLLNKKILRQDLYYRLNVFPIHVPPLRERKEDIPVLINAILDKLNHTHAKKIQIIHPSVIEAFYNYHWPGNIRELENVMERAYIIEQSSTLTPAGFPDEFFHFKNQTRPLHIDLSLPIQKIRRHAIENIEQEYLKHQLATNAGKINKTAAAAGITPRQLLKLLTRYGIDKKLYKSRQAK